MNNPKAKVVRSKDVLDAIGAVIVPMKGKSLPVGDVGFAIMQALSTVPEFYADELVEVSPPQQPEGK